MNRRDAIKSILALPAVASGAPTISFIAGGPRHGMTSTCAAEIDWALVQQRLDQSIYRQWSEWAYNTPAAVTATHTK